MYRIDVPGASPTLPAASAAGQPGYFTDGDLQQGREPTIVPAEFLNTVMLELLAISQGGGIAPVKGQNNQAWLAISALLRAVRLDVQNLALTYGPDTGAPGVYRVAYNPPITVLTDGMLLAFQAGNANTGPATFAPSGLVAKPLLGGVQVALQGGEISNNSKCLVIWHGSLNSWILLASTGGALQVGAATQSQHAVQLGQLGVFAQATVGKDLRLDGNQISADPSASRRFAFFVGG
jgi:hypothetical protein